MILLWFAACRNAEPVVTPPTSGTPVVLPAPLRRLTEEQYDRTVRDLFPGVVLPPQRLVDDALISGFDNNALGQVPSALLVERVQAAAVEVTAAAMESPETWLPCPEDGGPDPVACGREFLRTFGRQAFRRTLTADEEVSYLGFFEEQLADSGQFRVAIQLGMQAFLNSPAFLYFVEVDPEGGLTGPEIAVRLSYFLWGTMPDDRLLDAAERGDLDTTAGIEAEARRMVDDPKVRDAVLDFHRLWLDLDAIDDVWLHYDYYPSWSGEMNGPFRAELEEQVLRVWDGEGTLAALLLDRSTRVDDALSVAYDLPVGTEVLPSEERAGVLTRAGWLAAHAHMVSPSPVKRGVWVLDRLLCAPPSPPPSNVDTSIEPFTGTASTNRERYERHATDPVCAACHTAIDGIGFGFEGYDSMGSYRTEDNGAPVDASGVFALGDLAETEFVGGVELSELLAESVDAQGCYARQWYRYAIGRSEAEADGPVLAAIERDFVESGGDLRTVLIQISTIYLGGSTTTYLGGSAP